MRRRNPIADALADSGREPLVTAKPRPRLSTNEVRARCNRLAVALGVAYEEITALRRAVGEHETIPYTGTHSVRHLDQLPPDEERAPFAHCGGKGHGE